MSRDALVHVYRSSQAYAHRLLEGIPEDQLVRQPVPKMNHPAWVLGHLTVIADRGEQWLGGAGRLPESWQVTFGKGSIPQHDPRVYPGKDELLEAFDLGHERLINAYRDADDGVLTAVNDRVRPERFPTRGDAIAYMMTGHEMLHLGQLSAWRRVAGLPPVV